MQLRDDLIKFPSLAMNKAEFIALCRAHAKEHGEYVPWGAKPDGEPLSFVRAAECGGVSGGSCWDSSNPQAYHTEIADPGLGSVLDKFLEAHFPKLTFLDYRKLMRAVQVSSYSDRGYYGNRTDYTVWSLSFDDVWEVLEPMAQDLAA